MNDQEGKDQQDDHPRDGQRAGSPLPQNEADKQGVSLHSPKKKKKKIRGEIVLEKNSV